MSSKPTCERCGDELPCVEITMFGDREPRWLATRDCDCPAPRCPFSGGRLDYRGRCADTECFMWHEIVPLPEYS